MSVDDEIDSVLANVDRAKREHYARREQRAKKATATKKAQDIKAAFAKAYGKGDFAENVIPPTNKDIGIFKRHWKMYAGDRDIAEFLETVCTRWVDLKMGPLSWHKGFPAYPDFGFIGMNLRFFLRGVGELDKIIKSDATLGSRVRRKRNWRDVKGEH